MPRQPVQASDNRRSMKALKKKPRAAPGTAACGRDEADGGKLVGTTACKKKLKGVKSRDRLCW